MRFGGQRIRTALFAAFLIFRAAAGQSIMANADSVIASLPADERGIHIRIFANRWESIDLNTNEKIEHRLNGIGTYITLHKPIKNGKGLFLVKATGGPVYQVLDSAIVRIDKSYDHKMQDGGAIFSRNDTIFIQGGYGFWSVRNIMVYFDPHSSEWELYRNNKQSETPPGLTGHQHFIEGDSLFVFGGWNFDELNPTIVIPNKNAWIYDFRKRCWKQLGEPDFTQIEITRILTPAVRFSDGGWLLTFTNETIINPVTSTQRSCKLTHFLKYLVLSGHISPFTHNGRVYYYRHLPNNSALLELASIPESVLLSDCTKASPLIRRTLPRSLIAGLLFLLFAGTGLVLYRKRRKKTMVTSRPPDGKYALDPAELKLVNAFLTRFPESLRVQEVDEALETSQKSRDVQNQRRSQVIRSVNAKYMDIAGTDTPVINSRRSELDGRMIEYYLDPQGRERLEEMAKRK